MSPLSWHTKNKYIYMLLKASFLNDEENFKNNCFVLFMTGRSGDKPAKIHRATQHKSSAPKHSRYHHLPYHRIINIHATHYNDLHNFLIFFSLSSSLDLKYPFIKSWKIIPFSVYRHHSFTLIFNGNHLWWILPDINSTMIQCFIFFDIAIN